MESYDSKISVSQHKVGSTFRVSKKAKSKFEKLLNQDIGQFEGDGKENDRSVRTFYSDTSADIAAIGFVLECEHWRTCLHEAAHAVVAFVMDVHADRMRVRGAVGTVRYGGLGSAYQNRKALHRIEAKIMIYMAGPLAESVLDTGLRTRFDSSSAADAFHIEKNLNLLPMPRDLRMLYRSQLLKRCRKLVRELSPVIEEIAEVLRSEGALRSLTKIYRLINDTMAQHKKWAHIKANSPDILVRLI